MGKKKVMIVESGGKVEKLESYLGSEWKVIACGGHIRDMKAKGEGFDRKTLEINYEYSKSGKISLDRLKNATADAELIILAMDPDREGEAIADDLRICMKLKKGTYQRVAFSSVTKEVVLDAMANPREIDQHMVMAQRIRRMIDRSVGYDSTKALQIKSGIWTVVGRAQTPSLRIVVERDLLIEGFKSQTHFGLKLKTVDQWSCSIDAKASGLEDENGYWLDKKKAEELASKIKTLKVIKSTETESPVEPPNAFKTTTLQMAGINKLKVKGKEIMELAGNLYEEGYITYTRTDDERMTKAGYESLSEYVKKSRPELALSKTKRDPAGKAAANAQEAHECIRPTDFSVDKITVGGKITQKHVDLYRLIFDRALASQLEDAINKSIKLTLEGEHEGEKYIFTSTSSENIYLGWKKLTSKDFSEDDDDDDDDDDNKGSGVTPLLEKGKLVKIESGALVTKKTKPLTRYSEPKLIKEMERLGIGRPSTYSTIVGKLNKEGHGYLKSTTKNKKEILVSTEGGRKLIKDIEGTLGDGVLHLKYTQEMEDTLDLVSRGCDNPKQIMFDFLDRLAEENRMLMSNPNHRCSMPDCNGAMIQTKSKKTGKFYWVCTVEECKNIVNEFDGGPGESSEAQRLKKIEQYSNEDGTAMYPCPECKSPLILKNGKYGDFWSCSRVNDSECKGKAKDDEGKPMSPEKLKKIKAEKEKKENEAIAISTGDDGKSPLWECSKCKEMVIKRPTKKGGWWFKCSNEKCATRYWDNNKGEPKLEEPIED